MKKSIFYYAMATFVALGLASCGSDGDDNGGGGDQPIVIPAPANADKAISFTLSESEPLLSMDDNLQLNTLNFTESGKAVIGVTDKNLNKKKYVTYNVDYSADGTYLVKEGNVTLGKVILNKTATARGTRSTSNASLIIELSFIHPVLGEVTFKTDNPAKAVAKAQTMAASVNLTNISRTWAVESMTLALDFDEKKDVSTTVTDGNLSKFRELAEDNGVSLNATDRAALEKVIVGITFDKTSLFSIDYKNAETDAATWSWKSGSNEKEITLAMKDSDMGNKFLKGDSKIGVKFSGTKLILTLTTRLESDKCTATLMIVLK